MPVALRHRVAVLATSLLLVSPPAALGQSAGDEQYEDPFGGSAPQEQQEPAPAPESGAAPEPGAAPAPEPAAEPVATGESASEPGAPAQPSAGGGRELPRTGAPAGLVAAAGAALLAGGLALRRRSRDSG